MEKNIKKSYFVVSISFLYYMIISFIFDFLEDKKIINNSLWIDMIATIICCIIPILLFYRKPNTDKTKEIIKTKEFKKILFDVISFNKLCSLIIGIVSVILIFIMGKVNLDNPKQVEDISNLGINYMEILKEFIGACIIAPIFEETLFRGIIADKLKNCKKSIAILIPTVLFAFIHYNSGIGGIVTALISGLLLTYIYIKTNSLKISILLHSIINLFVILGECFTFFIIIDFGFAVYGIIELIKFKNFKNNLNLIEQQFNNQNNIITNNNTI